MGLPLKWALAAFALAGIGPGHTRSQSRLARAHFRGNGGIRGFGIDSRYRPRPTFVIGTIARDLARQEFHAPRVAG